MTRVQLVETTAEIQARVEAWRRHGGSIGFVPTMGALHAGHERLIQRARAECDRVVVSIFVNPLQFDRAEDLERYPRTLDADAGVCDRLGVDLLFVPTAHEMYPNQPAVTVDPGPLATHLCGAWRPGHFRGVATVVLKLLNSVRADRAYFGEKDAQQLAIIRRMVADFNVAVTIIGVPTVREADGLALSSRNARLSAGERALAPRLYQALRTAGDLIAAGATDSGAVKSAAARVIGSDDRVRLEYLEIVEPQDLQPVETIDGPVLIAGAVWVGSTRLIDNCQSPPEPGHRRGIIVRPLSWRTCARRLQMRRTLAAVVLSALVAAVAAAGVLAQARSASSTPERPSGITAIPGIKVGQYTMPGRPTGCTVVMVDGPGAVGGVSQRGGAPGTRETDLLKSENMVDKVNAIALSGGSAYGLDVATGVMKYLEEHGRGWSVGAAGVVPIVPSAILFDLGFGGDAKIRPNADCGYRAASGANAGPVSEGNFGAGAGATVGKIGGGRSAMKGGIGTASIALPNGLIVAAIAAVNASGDIIDPETNRVVAGTRAADGKTLADARRLIRQGAIDPAASPRPVQNTTIVVVATNAKMTKTEINRIATMADDGFARAIAPSHTVGDGDTVFTLATGNWAGTANPTIVGALAADVVSEAIVRAVSKAEALGGLPAARDLGTVPSRIK